MQLMLHWPGIGYCGYGIFRGEKAVNIFIF